MNMVLESEMTMQSMVLLCSDMNVSKSVIPAVKGMVSITLRTVSGLTSWSPAWTHKKVRGVKNGGSNKMSEYNIMSSFMDV